VIYGTSFWKEVLNFEALVRYGMIAEEDLELFQFADDVDTAFGLLQAGLTKHYIDPDREEPPKEEPAIAKSQT